MKEGNLFPPLYFCFFLLIYCTIFDKKYIASYILLYQHKYIYCLHVHVFPYCFYLNFAYLGKTYCVLMALLLLAMDFWISNCAWIDVLARFIFCNFYSPIVSHFILCMDLLVHIPKLVT